MSTVVTAMPAPDHRRRVIEMLEKALAEARSPEPGFDLRSVVVVRMGKTGAGEHWSDVQWNGDLSGVELIGAMALATHRIVEARVVEPG